MAAARSYFIRKKTSESLTLYLVCASVWVIHPTVFSLLSAVLYLHILSAKYFENPQRIAVVR